MQKREQQLVDQIQRLQKSLAPGQAGGKNAGKGKPSAPTSQQQQQQQQLAGLQQQLAQLRQARLQATHGPSPAGAAPDKAAAPPAPHAPAIETRAVGSVMICT